MKRWTKTRGTFVGVLAACLLCCATVDAKKGGNGGGGGGGGGDEAGQNGGGVIYFSYEGHLYTMKDDGSEPTLVSGFPEGYWPWGEPSRQLHNGKRWLPQMRGVGGETYPDGTNRNEFVALSDAGDVVAIGIAPDLNPLEQPKWCVGDQYVSWVGRRWDIDGESPTFGDVIDGGLYLTELAFDVDGNVSGITVPSVLLAPIPLVLSDGLNGPSGVVPDIRSHDWGPEGDQFVFATQARTELVIADPLAATFQVIPFDGLAVWLPRWSAANKLMFRYAETRNRSGVWVMNIDGTGLKMFEAWRSTSQPEIGVWSPTGSHLLYRHLDHFRENSYIVRATSNGTDERRITDGSVGAGFWSPWPLGWRD